MFIDLMYMNFKNMKGSERCMSDIIKLLERARAYELESGVQLEHIERLHRIAARVKNDGRDGTEYAVKIAEKLAALEAELNRQIDLTVDAKREAIAAISFLEGEERAIIFDYYINAKNWQKIAYELYMSERRVYLLRKSALEKLEKRGCIRKAGGKKNGNRTEDKAVS